MLLSALSPLTDRSLFHWVFHTSSQALCDLNQAGFSMHSLLSLSVTSLFGLFLGSEDEDNMFLCNAMLPPSYIALQPRRE
jgi:ABC-type antimicrobial peptide transport system permease subunit